MHISKHAQVRMQQRAISTRTLNILNQYGRKVHDGHKGIIVFLDKKAKDRIRMDLPKQEYLKIERKLDVYCVESDGQIITVGHRYKPVHH
ncbi:hypothetical protein D5125_02820 [Magnetovirga frankeli]|uniref:hypothetical protein n=1 Tax=Magnetovirga frankeli TaxID=947516 RepID=UPI001293016A|nr:hypothetical protein D5125_02820 [gamma proteobacterium SS-5]